jgi:hypothetical protein
MRKRVIIFGIVSGLLWSALPIWFSERSAETFWLYPTAGILTGVLASLSLYRLLLKSRLRMVGVLGLLALPVSAFYFGVCVGLLQALTVPGSLLHEPLIPLYSGLLFGYVSVAICFVPYWGLVLFPAAVLTTGLLRFTLLYKAKPPTSV